MNSEQRIKEIRAYLQMACGLVLFGVLIYHNVIGHLTLTELFQWLGGMAGAGFLSNGLAMRWQNNNGKST